MSLITKQYLQKQVKLALQEDIGSGDVTAHLVPKNQVVAAQLISRDNAVVCGTQWFDEVFNQLDKSIIIDWKVKDSEQIQTNQLLCTITGNARTILTGERTAMNFLQTLSGTATLTNKYVNIIKDTKCRILDTRKTIPNLRLAQKYAVSCGGGMNHRIGLFDAILIKENHISAAGSITLAVKQAKQLYPDLFLETEVETLAELEEAIKAGVDRVLLDNMDVETLKEAVSINSAQLELEASGGITIDNLREVAETGIDYISIGSLTKHLQAVDLSMVFT